jgi:hypothetical protein
MPRRKRQTQSKSPSTAQPQKRELSPGQAAYVLERLVKDRKITQSDVNQYVSDMGREISELEARLQRLKDANGGVVALAAAGIAGAAAAGAIVRRGRRPGRKPGRPVGSGRKPGRPPASAGAAAGASSDAAPGPITRLRRRAAAITAEQLASRQLQGRYLALVRQFSENKRAQYAKIAKDRGREAAINEMQAALRK